MKKETPPASESRVRIEVANRMGGSRRFVGETGAPAWAKMMFRPTARSSVLLPDMFEPVTRTNVPDGPISTSLRLHLSSAMSG